MRLADASARSGDDGYTAFQVSAQPHTSKVSVHFHMIESVHDIVIRNGSLSSTDLGAPRNPTAISRFNGDRNHLSRRHC